MMHSDGQFDGTQNFVMVCKDDKETVIQKLEFLLSADKTFKMIIPKGQIEKLENIFVSIQTIDEGVPETIGRFFLLNFLFREL